MNKIPCEDCISLPACISRIVNINISEYDYEDDIAFIYIFENNMFDILSDVCILFDRYFPYAYEFNGNNCGIVYGDQYSGRHSLPNNMISPSDWNIRYKLIKDFFNKYYPRRSNNGTI